MVNEMEIIEISIDDLKPYEKNPRKNEASIEKVAASIREFGFKVPVVIDKDNVIVCGHTRLEAAKVLGLHMIPCIMADDLTDEQTKAYRLADNKVGEQSAWDFELLSGEIEGIFDINMSEFGFDISDDEEEDAGYYGDERERTNEAYNLGIAKTLEKTNDFWQMPIIKSDNVIPERLIGFNYALTSKDKKCGIHCFVDDYQFERVWNDPDKYLDVLREYECVLTPDFSLYMDMDMPVKIWNIYRSRLIGAYWQKYGVNVVPTISWAQKETFDFCFKGIIPGGTVAVSTIGVKSDEKLREVWYNGMDEMMRQIRPKTVLVYGGELEYDFKKATAIFYDNEVTERWGK